MPNGVNFGLNHVERDDVLRRHKLGVELQHDQLSLFVNTEQFRTNDSIVPSPYIDKRQMSLDRRNERVWRFS